MSKDSLPNWVNLPEGYSGEMAGDRVIVRSDEHPEFYMDIRINDGERNPAATFTKKFTEYEGGILLYSEAIDHIKKESDFEFTHENQNLIISKPDCDFKMSFAPTSNGELAFHNLTVAGEAIENKALAAVDKLEELKKNGFSIEKLEMEAGSSDVSMKIYHDKLEEPVQITLRGELEIINDVDMKKLENALVLVNSPPTIKKQLNVAVGKDFPIDKLTIFEPEYTPKPELDGKDKVSLVFDANPIFNLASSRNGGRSWLDLLPITADLPNVEKIYIPAAVADWELCGGASYLDQAGNLKFQQIRDDTNGEKNITGALVPAIKEFMKDASHSVLDDSGNRHWIEGKNPNIVIYETEFDHKLLKGVRDIDNPEEFIKNKKKIKSELASLTGIENCDIGEYAMEQVAKEVRKNSDVFLVCDDNKYLQNRDSAKSNSIASNQIGSNGFLVGTTGTYGLVNAELSVRGQEIQKKLEQQHGYIGIKNLTWNTIKGDIEESGQHGGNYSEELCFGGTAGRRGMEHGKSLEDHIAYGLSLGKSSEISENRLIETEQKNMVNNAPEIPYQQTFGYKVGFHRIERKMSEDDLAEAVKEIAETQDKQIASRDYLNADTVKNWERNRVLPDKEHYEAIVKVLVDENEHIAEKDKNKVRKEFEEAYSRANKAINEGRQSYSGEHGSDMFAFADVLSKYRKAADIKEGRFAELLRKQLKFDVEEKPEDISAKMMLEINGNGYVPSFGLVRAMVKALDARQELSEEDKQEIFDAYSLVKDKRTLAQSLERGSTPELDELKKKMFELFKKDGKQATMQEISYAAELNSAALSHIFGKTVAGNPKEKTLRERGEKLSNALREMTKDENKVTLFDALFESFISIATERKKQL